MKKVGWLLILALIGCTTSRTATRKLNVFAASSLTNAFTEIGAAFEAEHPGLSVQFNFAGSPVLGTQIQGGAPADVIALASIAEMTALANAGLVDPGAARQVFASNQMVVILPAGNPGQVHSLEDLARPGIKLVLTAEQVPAGGYARQVLENLNGLYGSGFDQSVLRNVVSNEENVRQAVSKVQLGEADAGIVYLSDAAAVPDLQTLAIPDEMNESALYPVATLKSSPSKDAAEFIEFVLSEKSQSILRRWGFLPPPG